MEPKFDYEIFYNLVDCGKIEDAFNYRATFTPDYLYKFYPLTDEPTDSNQKRFYSLRNNLIWFANPETQNDPYEFRGVYWEEDKLLAAGVQQQSIDHAYELLFHKTALAAFTANMGDNLPMWAHYANKHHGYCVKYKVENKRTFRNVIYDDKRIAVTRTFLNFLRQGLRLMNGSDPMLRMQVEKDFAILQDKFFCKHTSWSYENEYRALYPFDGSLKGLNVPINELSLSIMEIYSGINCCNENRKELAQIASELDVPYKECSMSDIDYTVFQEF